MKTMALIALLLSATAANATISHHGGFIASAVRANQIAQQRAAAAAGAQARANATGELQFANGGVYVPMPPTKP